jgi:hypothetical protein
MIQLKDEQSELHEEERLLHARDEVERKYIEDVYRELIDERAGGLIYKESKVGILVCAAIPEAIILGGYKKYWTRTCPAAVICPSVEFLFTSTTVEYANIEDEVRNSLLECYERRIPIGYELPWKKDQIKRRLGQQEELVIGPKHTSIFVLGVSELLERVSLRIWERNNLVVCCTPLKPGTPWVNVSFVDDSGQIPRRGSVRPKVLNRGIQLDEIEQLLCSQFGSIDVPYERGE